MAPLQQVGRHGGPNKCFGEFQKVVECMTNSKHDSYKPCQFLKDDYLECRTHRLERYKNFLIKKNLEEQGKDLEEVGLPYVKKRQFLTPKTLGLIDGKDDSVNVIRL